MASNLTAIIAGIRAQLLTVSGIANVYDHAPAKIGTTPAIVFSLGPCRPISGAYGEMALEWTLNGYLAVKDINFDVSEAEIVSLLPAIIEALGHDLDAHGAITDGQVLVSRAAPGRLTVGGVTYHAMQFTMTVVERFVYSYAL